MPETRANSGGISRKALIGIGAVAFVLSTWISYSYFHREGSAAPENVPPGQTARVPEAWNNSGESAPPEALPSGAASEPAGTPEPSPAAEARPAAPAPTAEPETQDEVAVPKSKASPEKSPARIPGKEKEAKAAPGKKEPAPAGPEKAEKIPAAETAPGKAETAKGASEKPQESPAAAPVAAETEAAPAPVAAKGEEVAKAPAGKEAGRARLQIGEYPDLKSMLKDMNRVKGLGFETTFEEKETGGGKKEHFLIVEKELAEGAAKAESLKLKVAFKLGSTIIPRPERKAELWIGPFAKLTEAVKTSKMLKEEGYSTRVETQKKSGKKIYLFAGPFADKNEMIKAKAVLKENGFSPESSDLP